MKTCDYCARPAQESAEPVLVYAVLLGHETGDGSLQTPLHPACVGGYVRQSGATVTYYASDNP